MKKDRRGKTAADAAILLCGCMVLLFLKEMEWNRIWLGTAFFLTAVCMTAAGVNLYFLYSGKTAETKTGEELVFMGIQQLILLDEQDKPIRSWNMVGKTAMVIGRMGREEEVDVDMTNCEYGSFIDFQHAVLNFCLDSWYIEDLESENGVKIKKAEDGECYKVMGRPCRIHAGDILYIANTRLLVA